MAKPREQRLIEEEFVGVVWEERIYIFFISKCGNIKYQCLTLSSRGFWGLTKLSW